MPSLLLYGYIIARHATASALRRTNLDERGEGVISAAIAVLIMAFLGAAMWVAFDRIFSDTTDKTERQVGEIGR
ncbi:MAG: hypothetical protein ABI239_13220 [Aquihabitans sp.]